MEQRNIKRRKIFLILAASIAGIFLFSRSAIKNESVKQIIRTEQAPAPIGPYSQATEAGGTIYLSGQIAIDPASGKLVEGGISAETRQVLENLKAVLEAAGADLTHVVKCSIFLSDMSEFAEMNKVYGEFFSSAPPARECVQVARLPKDVHVEISAIAVK